MSEQELDGADIGARLQEVDRKSVPKRVRRDWLGDSGAPASCFACHLHSPPGHRVARMVAREQPFLRPRNPPIGAQAVQQFGRQHHVAVFLALALLHADDHAPAIDRGGLQVDRL